jgi:hypothetical protein
MIFIIHIKIRNTQKPTVLYYLRTVGFWNTNFPLSNLKGLVSINLPQQSYINSRLVPVTLRECEFLVTYIFPSSNCLNQRSSL